MSSRSDKKPVNNVETLLVIICFITLVTHRYNLLPFIVGITIGYIIMVHFYKTHTENNITPKDILRLFFSHALQNLDFDDEDAAILTAINENITNIVTSKDFINTNRNQLVNSHRLEIAIYKEIIKEIKNNESQLKIATTLLRKASTHLKRLENNEI